MPGPLRRAALALAVFAPTLLALPAAAGAAAPPGSLGSVVGDVPVTGDWDGNGTTTIGVFRGGVWFLRNSNNGGGVDATFGFGAGEDVPVTGDWDGDGTSTIGVYRKGTWYLRNSNSPGPPDEVFGWGSPEDVPVAGDWDGDGTTTIGVYRGGTWFQRNSNSGGGVDASFGWGGGNDIPLTGDWDGNGATTIGVRRVDSFLLRAANAGGPVDAAFAWGLASRVVAGDPQLSVSTVMAGLSNAWDLAFTPDGSVLVTERPGRISIRRPDGTQRQVAADLGDLFVAGESGLESIEVDPDFANNRRLYTCQASKSGPSVHVIAWTLDAGYSTLTRVSNPLVGGITLTSGRHGGCRIRVGPDGALWVGTGDAAVGTSSQDLTSLAGKVLRVSRFDGTAASGNPFAASANPNTRRIWTYGHRNVQGVAFRPGYGEVWTAEHGPDRDDEINRLVAGANYGWDPVPGYNESVPMTNLAKFPAAVPSRWSSGSPTLATSGIDFLHGAQWGAWNGSLAVAALKDQTLRILVLDPTGNVVGERIPAALNGTAGRLRTARQGPDGNLWVTTDNGAGADRLLVIRPL